MSTNPLLQWGQFFDFSAFKVEDVNPALDQLLADAEAGLEKAATQTLDYLAFSQILDVPLERLSRAWGIVGHLNSVADTPEIRAVYNENLGRITAFFTRLSSDERLYTRLKAILGGQSKLNAEQKRVLQNSIRDFVLGGAELKGASKERFAQIQARLAELSQAFSEHVMDATDNFVHYVPEDDLVGLPADLLVNCRKAAEQAGHPGCALRLHAPVYVPVMQYCTKPELRALMHRAYNTRASELGPAELDNAPIIAEILSLRAERASLLGFQNHAEVSLVPKMAQNPAEVLSFLRDLGRQAKAPAHADLHALEEFAKTKLGLAAIAVTDHAFVAEKLKEARYSFNSQVVRQYFPQAKVLAGLFKIIEEVFAIQVLPDSAPVWHPDVAFYRLERQGQLIGQFYLDLYARNGKRPGAWMDVVQSRWLRPDTAQLQLPIAYLICNFAPPVEGQPAMFTHDEITTLFHETGHGLHHLLTQVQELGVSGIAGVEWDAVELPSQFMENFCWEWEVLSSMSAHVETGASLPRELFDKMLAAKNFQSAWQMVRQLEFALTDMLIHIDPKAHQLWPQIIRQVRQEVAVVNYPDYNRFLQSFAHIFAGGYAAGYYSYKWAEVLSADCWSVFEDALAKGVALDEPGERFRREILAMGASRPAMESFVAFRGRRPTVDALLRHNGLI